MRQNKSGTTVKTLGRNWKVIKWDFLCFMFITGFMELASQDVRRGFRGMKTSQALQCTAWQFWDLVSSIFVHLSHTHNPPWLSVPGSGHRALARHTWCADRNLPCHQKSQKWLKFSTANGCDHNQVGGKCQGQICLLPVLSYPLLHQRLPSSWAW